MSFNTGFKRIGFYRKEDKMKNRIALLLILVFVTLIASSGYGAETVHLYLKVNGQDVKGESTQISLGRADSIECVYYEQSVAVARDTATGMATGRRTYNPIVIHKRIDKSSPLLVNALRTNAKVDGVFKFFRPNPTGDGTTQQFYTVEFKNGQIASFRQFVPNTIVPASSSQPPMEEVTFIFHTIIWTYTNGGVMSMDTVGGPAR
jgi:type VI secretion system secreted protein Hcp